MLDLTSNEQLFIIKAIKDKIQEYKDDLLVELEENKSTIMTEIFIETHEDILAKLDAEWVKK